MRRLTISTFAVLAVSAVCATVGASTASARSDGVWLTTRTAAAAQLPGRFKNIASVTCAPDTASATEIYGTTRYWQRFWCSGRTYGKVSFRLRFKVTGQCGACWTVTNLSGVTSTRLRVRQVVAAPSTSGGSGSSSSCGEGYYRNSVGNCVPSPSSDPTLEPGGPTAVCEDGTYSYSQSASGTCSHHGGVARWINHP
jgi:hypothetical protein